MKTSTALKAAVGAVVLSLGLAACSSGSTEDAASSTPAQTPLEDTQTINMLNYAGWMGSGTVEAYQEQNRNITIEQSDLPSGGEGGITTLLRQNTGAYDFALLGSVSAGTLAKQGVLADFDASQVPNLENVPEEYREAYPWGIPLEQGKVGIVYRTDKVDNPPTSWADLFDRMDEFKGRVAFPDYDIDVFSMALLALGEDINTDDTSKLEEAAQLVTDVKPDIKAFLSSDRIKALTDGSVDIAIVYDYETVGALGDDSNLAWIAPSEGLPAYMDGWPIFAESTHQPATYDFMNFALDLDQYADFINTTGASYLIPDVESKLDQSILDNPALAYDADVKVHYEQYVSGEINAKRAELWEQIKAS